ncbi:hypothetical protein CVD28_00915 [Bacillus sp. M6-12]|uniref:hypothetical protein n=1 Tax=Bacillus sp. M6-12 TaxID=2054166 RepID=UPI000C78F010|nr:hypothetical protein [Bacillus sp. M6-12]PLS18994.1 hypothetical protein CVD28_00915 [Bacillus sp. M6-12]
MKLTKREAGFIRQVAFFQTVLEQNTEGKLRKALSMIPEKKHSLSMGYYDYLTTADGKKSYVVDFKTTSGAGNLTYHDCTAEEAEAKALHVLQNGAFGKYEKLEDITIQGVYPDTIYYNQFEDYLKWESQMEQLA